MIFVYRTRQKSYNSVEYRRQKKGELKVALSTIINEFTFSNGNKIKFECDNCQSYDDVKVVYYNDKKVRSFKGV